MRRLEYDYVYNYIKQVSNNECELISKEYLNAHQKLDIRCRCGNIFQKNFNKIYSRHTHLQCRECMAKESSERQRLNFDYVLSFINNNSECEYISGNYENNDSKLLFKCKCGKFFKKSYGHFMSGQTQCETCSKSKNTYGLQKLWTDKNSDAYKEIRRYLNSWRYMLLKQYLYKCPVTGETSDLVVHHIDSFSNIVSQTSIELQIPIYNWVSDYEINNFYKLKDAIVEKHNYYTGIPLHKSIHFDFHKKYGNGYNTKDQFAEYLMNEYMIDLDELQSKYAPDKAVT